MDSLKYFFLFFPVLFIGVWVLVFFIISRFGWAKLATHYASDADFPGTRIGLISLAINWVSYNNSLVMKYNERGMYLKPLLVFRLFHKPILIPWKDIVEVRDRKLHFFNYKELVIGNPAITKLSIRSKTFSKIQNNLEYYSRPG